MNLSTAKDLDVDVQPLPVINTQSTDEIEITGKVIKPYSSLWLYFAIIVDNLASQSCRCCIYCVLVEFNQCVIYRSAIRNFSSLMTLTPKILGGYSGTIVSNIGYPNFFLMTTLIGIPI